MVQKLGYVGAGIEVYQSFDEIASNWNDALSGNTSAIKNIILEVTDIGFAAVSTFGGPVGAGVSSVYYVIRVIAEHKNR